MKRQTTLRSNIKLTAILYAVAIAGTVLLINACHKSAQQTKGVAEAKSVIANNTPAPIVKEKSIISVVNVAAIRKSGDGLTNKVMFDQLEEIFTVQDATILASLQTALKANKTIKVSIDPWNATVLTVSDASVTESQAVNSAEVLNNPGTARRVDLTNTEVNNPPEMAVLNNTTSNLVDVIPDMATAQLMFDYIAHQCCALPGPYTIDYCISFQYCEDGCYARAHKMCWILNNKYNYATHKIFSFANAGLDELCVKGEKWGGCCVNWWYHVAPLVNIKTPSGTHAYVFDPAMFDQPVLLATWLHAQENPACVPGGDVPHVSMINIQPTASYSPRGTTGYLFYTDPTYTSTDATLTSYAPLLTCP